MKSDKEKDDEKADAIIAPNYEQNGGHFNEDDELKPGEGLLYHGRPLSEAEIEELRLHKENNKFLGISDTPEVGTGAGNVGGMIPDVNDYINADELKDHSERDSNFGRNYQGGNQSQDHFIETESHHKHKKEEDKKKE